MRIIATVTNDLNYDQRMHRICGTLVGAGYEVCLVGRVLTTSIPLRPIPTIPTNLHDAGSPFLREALEGSVSQVRLQCLINKGPLFYLEYNFRLFWFLMLNAFDAVNIVDLDTMPAGYLASMIKGKKSVFDAHEHFTEVPEVTHRPIVKWIWHQIGKWCIPSCNAAYTVGPKLAEILSKTYGKSFGTVRNMPMCATQAQISSIKPPFTEQPYILYQGALNVGRGLEEAIDAMQEVNGLRLLIVGEGDISSALRAQVEKKDLSEKVVFLGQVLPKDLVTYSKHAWLGLNLLENKGLSYYYSLANKFFDYIQAGVPSLNMDFPEYRAINDVHHVAILLPILDTKLIAQTITNLQQNEKAHRTLRQACLHATEEFRWERERDSLLNKWSIVFTA